MTRFRFRKEAEPWAAQRPSMTSWFFQDEVHTDAGTVIGGVVTMPDDADDRWLLEWCVDNRHLLVSGFRSTWVLTVQSGPSSRPVAIGVICANKHGAVTFRIGGSSGPRRFLAPTLGHGKPGEVHLRFRGDANPIDVLAELQVGPRRSFVKDRVLAGRAATSDTHDEVDAQDSHVNRDERFSLGFSRNRGVHYLSIPVSAGVVDYEEYYALTPEEYDTYIGDPGAAIGFARLCKQQELQDVRLLVEPSWNRGVA